MRTIRPRIRASRPHPHRLRLGPAGALHGLRGLRDIAALDRDPVTTRAFEAQEGAPQLHEPPAEKPQAEAARESASSWEIDVTFGPEAGNPAEERAAAAEPPAVTPLQAEAEPQREPARTSAPSLGSSLIANGIVARPRAKGPDPMAPIRRMTQNEKIAFFS